MTIEIAPNTEGESKRTKLGKLAQERLACAGTKLATTSGLPGSAELDSTKQQGTQTEVKPAVVYSARRRNPNYRVKRTRLYAVQSTFVQPPFFVIQMKDAS